MFEQFLEEKKASTARVVFRLIAYILIILTTTYFLLALTSTLGEVFSFAKSGFFNKFKALSTEAVYYSFVAGFLVALCFLVLGSTRSNLFKITGVITTLALGSIIILSAYYDFKMSIPKGVESPYESAKMSGFFIQNIYAKPLSHNLLKQILTAFKLEKFAHYKWLALTPFLLVLITRFHAAGKDKKYLAFLRLGLDILAVSFILITVNLFVFEKVTVDAGQHALVYSSLILSALGFGFLLAGTIVALFHIKKY